MWPGELPSWNMIDFIVLNWKTFGDRVFFCGSLSSGPLHELPEEMCPLVTEPFGDCFRYRGKTGYHKRDHSKWLRQAWQTLDLTTIQNRPGKHPDYEKYDATTWEHQLAGALAYSYQQFGIHLEATAQGEANRKPWAVEFFKKDVELLRKMTDGRFPTNYTKQVAKQMAISHYNLAQSNTVFSPKDIVKFAKEAIHWFKLWRNTPYIKKDEIQLAKQASKQMEDTAQKFLARIK